MIAIKSQTTGLKSIHISLHHYNDLVLCELWARPRKISFYKWNWLLYMFFVQSIILSISATNVFHFSFPIAEYCNHTVNYLSSEESLYPAGSIRTSTVVKKIQSILLKWRKRLMLKVPFYSQLLQTCHERWIKIVLIKFTC